MKPLVSTVLGLALTASVVVGPVLGVVVAERLALFFVWGLSLVHVLLSPVILVRWGITDGEGAAEYYNKIPRGGRLLLSRVLGTANLLGLVGAGWIWTGAVYAVAWVSSYLTRHAAKDYAAAEPSASTEAA